MDRALDNFLQKVDFPLPLVPTTFILVIFWEIFMIFFAVPSLALQKISAAGVFFLFSTGSSVDKAVLCWNEKVRRKGPTSGPTNKKRT